MTLEAKLKDIQKKLMDDSNFQKNEDAVSQGIVLPILRELNWDTDDTSLVWPEYTVGGGRADFALCGPTGHSKVKAFVEVKGLGGVDEKAEEQVVKYALSRRVRIVVLTDGKTWSFYLLFEDGSHEERRVFKLDLSEHSPQKSSEFLQRYLEKSGVVSGEALRSALMDLGDRKRLEKVRKEIPVAWRNILEASESDESLNSLVGVLAGRVKSKVRVRPDDNDVVDFLRSLRQEGQVPAPPPSGTNGGGRSGELVILGKSFHYGTASEAMVRVFQELESRKPGFCQRFYNDPRNHGRTRRIIAQDARSLYDHVHLVKYHKQIAGNWVISTNNSKLATEKIIRIAAEVAGLKFGRDIIIKFDA